MKTQKGSGGVVLLCL